MSDFSELEVNKEEKKGKKRRRTMTSLTDKISESGKTTPD